MNRHHQCLGYGYTGIRVYYGTTFGCLVFGVFLTWVGTQMDGWMDVDDASVSVGYGTNTTTDRRRWWMRSWTRPLLLRR